MDTRDLAHIRTEYKARTLTEDTVGLDPILQFNKWFTEALESEVMEPNAMALATATPDGFPACRIVLLKGLNKEGFIFYTNYHSDKGQMLAANPHAALTFFWPELERQVRVEGTVVKLSPEESDEYFSSRPKSSRIGAWVSEQSREIIDRKTLDDRLAELEKHYENEDVLRPPHWGGYALQPRNIEFWQGRPNRLHDRLKYIKEGEHWKLVRLQP